MARYGGSREITRAAQSLRRRVVAARSKRLARRDDGETADSESCCSGNWGRRPRAYSRAAVGKKKKMKTRKSVAAPLSRSGSMRVVAVDDLPTSGLSTKRQEGDAMRRLSPQTVRKNNET